ncbi:MAG TPA: GNAT family N-acetyltransferase [Candidatus Binataceae bacterium]|nr:GNAT family N-acetyltransferase [Candidatus Binataceae bacterium]
MSDKTTTAPPSAASYLAIESLRDGSPIRVRAIRPDDKERLLEHFRSLSPQSVYFRFFEIKRTLGDDDLLHLTELDFTDHVGLAATMDNAGREQFIGVGRYLRSGGKNRAEVAFAVLDEHQGRGIGTLLLQHLGRIAKTSGITQFTADVMGGNKQMLEVFANSGFRTHDSHESGTVRVLLDLDVPSV